ncbi:MAG: carboxypeptidase regulatory-like domain-containing protein [Elusimicrobia bacterium]|nr:carboxypeptidase regulatory-like domain-containing protein [Elusimicrobiota bacterium]
MTAPAKCPGCGAKLEPDMLACPNCPMSFPEDDSASEVHPLKQTRWYGVVMPLLFFAGIGALIWMLATGFWRLAQENNQADNSSYPTRGAPAEAAPEPGTDASAVSAASTAAAVPAEDQEVLVTGDASSSEGASAAPARAPAAAPAPPPPPPPTHWRLRGTVYDLSTLKPLPGCWVRFVDVDANRSVTARTDAGGRYRTIVPALDGRGYEVRLSKSGYAPSYLDPRTRGVREMSAAERAGLARGLATTLTQSPAVLQTSDAKPLITDFYLAPRP